MGRALSPARSEVGFDISKSLFDDARTYSASESVREGSLPPRGNDMLSATSTDDDEAAIAESQMMNYRKAAQLKGRTVKKGGGFQVMGLNPGLLKAITRKGFTVPTPIQRKTIPLLLQDRDVVGMARTGSGKTGAFVIPMIEKLKSHSLRIGARALILSPARELALQTLQVVKELGRGTDLRTVLLVGGDSLDEQFAAMTSNPDVVIATPGRFLHLKVEMGLDLSSMHYVVFDEADRLFEMGFAAQLTEILHALPASRQTLLFSATLPKSLVEFARAGLQDPALVRLDADSKIAPDLKNAFLAVKSAEKEAALLHILQNVIKMPSVSRHGKHNHLETSDSSRRKRKRGQQEGMNGRSMPSPFSTIVFVSTKHHVEYLAQLLRLAGFSVSHVYSSLDQAARKNQVQAFRSGTTNILVATDIGARGIDIPILANVINYDFPSQPKVFVHRVGRTARAGQAGWSYSLINETDSPYLVDLQLFLSKKLLVGRQVGVSPNYSADMVMGSLRDDQLQASEEWVSQNLEASTDLAALRSVAAKGEKQYRRSRNSASSESVKRAKELVASASWQELHPLFTDASDAMEIEREKMLGTVSGFRPSESIFEITARTKGRRRDNVAAETMRNMRPRVEAKRRAVKPARSLDGIDHNQGGSDGDLNVGENSHEGPEQQAPWEPDLSNASDSELEVTFSQPATSSGASQSTRSKLQQIQSFQDSENFMSYLPTTHRPVEDRAYGVHSGATSNFTEAARGATIDLSMDESARSFGEARGIMRWDKRQRKYVARQNDNDGSKGTRLIRGESGAKIAASFRKGRYDAWLKAHRINRTPRIGEAEGQSPIANGGGSGRRYRHQAIQAPKPADKYRGDFLKKKQQVKLASEREQGRRGKNELHSVDDMRKARREKEKRKAKNARPPHRNRK